MGTWSSPPEFPHDGSSPPLKHPIEGVSRTFMTRPGGRTENVSACGHLVLSPFREDAGFGLVDASWWVIRNLGSHPMPEFAGGTTVPAAVGVGEALMVFGGDRKKAAESIASDIRAAQGAVSLLKVDVQLCWVRDNAITQLPPGVSTKVTSRTTVGLSDTTATELGRTIGFEGSLAGILKANAALAGRLNLSNAVSSQREVTSELTLANDRADYYRRYAVWRQNHVLTVDELVMGVGSADLLPTWQRNLELDVLADESVALTSADTPIR